MAGRFAELARKRLSQNQGTGNAFQKAQGLLDRWKSKHEGSGPAGLLKKVGVSSSGLRSTPPGKTGMPNLSYATDIEGRKAANRAQINQGPPKPEDAPPGTENKAALQRRIYEARNKGRTRGR